MSGPHGDMVVVFKAKGQEVNPVYVDSLFNGGYNDWVSITYVEDGVVNIQRTDVDDKMTAEEFNEIQNSYKDNELYIAFGKGKIHEDCKQPFSVLERRDEPTLAAFLYGSYPSYEKKESNLTPAFFFLQEYVGPKLKQIARAFVCEPDYSPTDMTRLSEALNTTVSRKEFTTFATDSADSGITFVLANEGSFNFGARDQYTFSWGSTTNPLDYKEDGYPEKDNISEDTKPKGLLGRMKKPSSSPTEEKLPGDGTTNSSHGAGIKDTPKEEKPIIAKHDTVVLVKVGKFDYEKRLSDGFMRPLGKLTNSSCKKAYQTITSGVTPLDYKQRPWVAPKLKSTSIQEPVKDLKDLGPALDKLKDTSSHHIPATVNKKEEPVKQQEPAKQETSPTKEEPSTEATPPWEPEAKDKIPLLDPKAWSAVENYMNNGMTKKMLDNSSLIIPDPKTLQEKETMLPSFCSKLNLDLLKTVLYPFPWAVGLGEHNAKALAMLWNDTRIELFKRLTHEEKVAIGVIPQEETTKKLFGGIKKKAS